MTMVTGSWVLDAALLLIPLLYWSMTRNFGFFKKMGIPYMKPTAFVGNMGGVVLGRKHIGEPVFECYQRAGTSPFMGMFAFDEPLLMVKDLELVGRILATDFSTFHSLNFTIDPRTDPALSESLFGQHGPGWKKLRTILGPAFTSGKIKLMFNLVNEVGQRLVHFLEIASSTGNGVELKEVMSRFTTDVVCSIFMGVEINSLADPDNQVRVHVRNILRENFFGKIKTTMAFFAPRLMGTLRIRLGDKKSEDYFVENTDKLIKLRKEKGIIRNDLVDMLIKIKEEQVAKESVEREFPSEKKNVDGELIKLTNETIAGQLIAFLNAGFDSSSSTISFTLFELAHNRKLQDQTRQHIRHVLEKHDGQVTYDALNEMTHLTNVLNETLRLYPPLNFLDRRAMRPYKIPGTDIVLPKGTGVVMSVTGLHTDPRYWEEPHRYNPDRFKEENSKSRPSYTYLPFGEGPRLCIGSRIGYLQMKIGMVHILNNFEVYPLPETPTSVVYEPTKLIASPAGDVIVGFRKIPST